MLKQLWHYGAIPVKEVAGIVAVALMAGAVSGFALGRLFEMAGR